MTPAPVVIKVGGNDLDQPGFVPQLAQAVAALNVQQPCIVVHGGGRSIDALMQRMGIAPRFVDGQRVTDEAALDAAEMVLSGQVNKRLVLALLDAGAEAIGLSGVDRGLIHVEPWDEALGRVGRIVAVRADVLAELAAQRVVAVLSPISAGPGGRYNVNADHAAGAVAGAVSASRVVFVTNVPGVSVDGASALRLTAGDVQRHIETGAIHGGMIPKVRAALDALDHGVPQAVITDLPGLRSGTGTVLVM